MHMIAVYASLFSLTSRHLTSPHLTVYASVPDTLTLRAVLSSTSADLGDCLCRTRTDSGVWGDQKGWVLHFVHARFLVEASGIVVFEFLCG